MEHCPPKSFFPEGQRSDLITVPSCSEHNNAQSKDVEYVRNAITSLWGVNNAGLTQFESKTKKSFERSPKLMSQTFETLRTLLYGQQVTGAFTVDLARFEKVFKACACALHFHDTHMKHANWGIVMPRFVFHAQVPGTNRQDWTKLCEMLKSVPFTRQPAANPTVFDYGAAELQGNRVYCFVLYGRFVAYALPLPAPSP